MPKRLRPKTKFAERAILVGDPGRSLLLAQELLEQPKMSNHARGLWGYTGHTAAGEELTIQATGMGGPSAALVLADLAKLGVKRVVRVGTCAGLGGCLRLGELLLPNEAISAGGSATSFGLQVGAAVEPDAKLLSNLREALDAQEVAVASLDTMLSPAGAPSAVIAADMQTATVFAQARELGIAAAAVLIVSQKDDEVIDDEDLDAAAKRAGQAAMKGLI